MSAVEEIRAVEGDMVSRAFGEADNRLRRALNAKVSLSHALTAIGSAPGGVSSQLYMDILRGYDFCKREHAEALAMLEMMRDE